MCKKSIHLASLILVLGLAGTVSAELVAYWRFDGDFTDATGNGHDGTAFDSAAIVDDPVRGQVLETDGTGRVRVGDAADLNYAANESFSYMLWAKYDPALAGSGWRTIFVKGRTQDGGGTTYNADVLYGFWVSPGGTWHVSCGGVRADTDPALADQWHHLATVQDGGAGTVTFYIDGREIPAGGGAAGPCESPDWPLFFGAAGTDQSPFEAFGGRIDEAQIYNHALTEDEILSAMQGAGAFPYARRPEPSDGAIYPDTWVNLSWSPGDSATSHDVYLGDNFDDVNNATLDSSVFRGNQGDAFIIAGFFGFPYPNGLVPGTTYYWRIDEVNDADPNSPWKGNVWSFWIPPTSAYEPIPSDGAKFVPADAELSWTAGFGSKLHYVHFGDNFNDVNNSTVGAPASTTTFSPGALEMDKTYYWRVDEFNPPATIKGDIWSFTTALPGLGTAVMDRWENITTTDINTLKNDARFPNNPDVTETLNSFAWNGPDIDDYGARIEAWVYVPATGDYTFRLNSDDQGELWLSTDDDPSDAVLIASESSYSDFNAWGSGEEQSDPIALAGGEKYYITALWKEGVGGDHCQVAWQGPGIPDRTVIAGTYLSPFEPLSAYGAEPSNRATGVTLMPILTWKPGLGAASHEVYFGTEEQAVADATTASPEYKAIRQLGDESLDPGKLAWDSTYYWRVDEVNNTNADSPWAGAVWSFATGDFLIVDDFESYDDIDPAPGEPGINRIFDKWIDGFGATTNGALVGSDLPPYAERTVVHSGIQSMIYSYDNAGKTSEATLTLIWPRDWTEEGVTKLSLWVNGGADNAADRIYVALNGTAVIYHEEASATQIEGWNEWVIDLSAFAGFGVNPTNVNTITIGVGTRNAPASGGGTGTMYFDDIRLYR